MQCYRPTHGTRFLRWTELRLGNDRDLGENKGDLGQNETDNLGQELVVRNYIGGGLWGITYITYRWIHMCSRYITTYANHLSA